jgi:uncharacterized protein DUF2589
MPQSNEEQATQLLNQVPLGAIVGAPLKAAVDAQAAAAVACYNFIRSAGFEDVERKDENGTSLTTTKVKEITFTFERKRGAPPGPKDGPGEKAQAQPPGGRQPALGIGPANADAGAAANGVTRVSITVPLLTVMPIPFIRIESMTVNFKASITADDGRTETTTSSDLKELKGDATLGFAWWKVNVGGSISSKKDSTATNTSKYSVEHTMDISVHAVQDDMPAGMAKLLSYMTDAITVARD